MADNQKMGVLLQVGLSKNLRMIKEDLVSIQNELNKYKLELKTDISASSKESQVAVNAYKQEVAVASDLADVTKEVRNAKNDLIKTTKLYKDSADIERKVVEYSTDAQRNYTETTDKSIANAKKYAEVIERDHNKALLENQKRTKSLTKSIEDYAHKLEIARRSAQETVNTTKDFGTANQRTAIRKLADEIHGLTARTNMTGEELKQASKRLQILQNDLRATSKEAKAMGNNSMTFGKMMSTAFEKFAIWMTATTVFFGIQRVIKDMIGVIKELDTSLVELEKVTDLTNNQLDIMKDKAFIVADAVSATATEVIRATADFARMGFEAEKAMDLAKVALMLKNIGDGIDSVDDATATIISTLKGFQMEAGEAMHVIDALNNVSNKYAVDTASLAEGLRNASATMHQSSTSFEETIAILTAGNEIMQNMSKTSTGLVTISQRLRGLSEAMEDGEDSVGFVAKLQQAFKDIANVDIMEEGKLRSTYDILVDMAEAQERLTAEQMQYLGELAAGKRQVKVWNSILMNSETLTKANVDAVNSQNSAFIENQKVLNSVEGKTKKFQNTLQELYDDTMSSESLKTIIDFGTGFLKLVDVFGMLEVVIPLVVGMITANLIPSLVLTQVQMDAMTKSALLARKAISGLYGIIATVAVIGTLKLVDAIVETTAEWQERLAENLETMKQIKDTISDLEGQLENSAEMSEKEVAILEKQLQLEQLKLEASKRTTANQLNSLKVMEDIHDLGNDTIYTIYQDPEEADNAIRNLRVIQSEIEKMTELRDKENITTEEGRRQYENYNRQINHAIGLEAKYTQFLMDRILQYESIPFDMIDAEHKKEYYLLLDILGIQKELGIEEEMNTLKQIEHQRRINGSRQNMLGTLDKQVLKERALTSALTKFNETGKISEYMLQGLRKQFLLYDLTLDENKQTILELAEQVGLSAEDRIQFEIQLTEIVIQETLKRIKAHKAELASLVEMMDGAGVRDTLFYEKAYMHIDSAIDKSMANIEALEGNLKSLNTELKEVRESGSENTKEQEKYFNQLVNYERLVYELEMERNKSAVTGITNYEEQARIIGLIQDELARLNDSDRERLETLDKESEEYKNLQDTIRNRSKEWWTWEKAILDMKKEQTDAQKKLADEYKKSFESVVKAQQESFKEQHDDWEEQLKEKRESEEKSLEQEEEAWSESYEERKKIAEDAYESEKDLWEKSYDERKTSEERAIDDAEELWKRSYEDRKKAEERALEDEENAWKADLDNRKKTAEDFYDSAIDGLDEELEALKEQRDIEDEISKLQEKQIELMEAQIKLQNISQEKDIPMWMGEDEGFQWVADPRKIEDQQNEIVKLEEELSEIMEDINHNNLIRELEQEKEYYKESKDLLMDSLEEEKITLGNYYNEKNLEMKRRYEDENDTNSRHYDDLQQEIKRRYEDEKTIMSNYFDETKKIMDEEFEQESIKMESHYEQRAKDLENYYDTQEEDLENHYDRVTGIFEEIFEGISESQSDTLNDMVRELSRYIDEYESLLENLVPDSKKKETSTNSPSNDSKTPTSSKGAVSVLPAYKGNKYAEQMAENSRAWHYADSSTRKALEKENEWLASQLGFDSSDKGSNGRWDKILQYAKGGDVNKDGVIVAHNKEGVLTKDMNQAFKMLVSDITGKYVQGVSTHAIRKNDSGKAQQIVKHYDFDKLILPNVRNGKDFLNELDNLTNLGGEFDG